MKRWVVSFTPRPLYPWERVPGTHWIGGWVGPRTVLDAVVKRKIPSSRRESNPRTPIFQPVAQRYTDWAITPVWYVQEVHNPFVSKPCRETEAGPCRKVRLKFEVSYDKHHKLERGLRLSQRWCFKSGSFGLWRRGELWLDTEVSEVHFTSFHFASPWRWRQHGPPKRWYPTTTLQGVTTQKTSTWNIRAPKTLNMAIR
jgi:hypothetical protein